MVIKYICIIVCTMAVCITLETSFEKYLENRPAVTITLRSDKSNQYAVPDKENIIEFSKDVPKSTMEWHYEKFKELK